MGLPSTRQDLGGPKIIFAYSKGENDPKITGKPSNKIRVLLEVSLE